MDSPRLNKSTSSERRDSSALDLVNNVEALSKLFGQVKSDEFTEHLYDLFEAHGKVKQLFSCAIELELANTQESASTFAFSTNSILYKLMLLLIHSDFGRKYLKYALDPLFLRCASFTENTDESVFVEEVTSNFLQTLCDYSERCPIAFQEVLIQFDTALRQKFPNENILPSLLCNHFLCDVIERPQEYSIFEKHKEVTSVSPQLLVKITSQLKTCQNQLSQLVSKLTDPATVVQLKELIDSNQVVNVEKIQREAEDRMQQYLKGDKIHKTFQDQLQFEESKTRLLKIMDDTEGWSKMTSDKTYGIQGWIKKYEWSPVVVWRFETVFKTTLAKFTSVIIDHAVLLKRDKRIEVGKEIKLPTTNDNRHFYYVRTAASFPVSSRDFVIVRHDEWSDKEGLFIIYSIEHEDFPKFPKIVRGQILNTCGHVTVNETNTEVKFVYTAQVDPKGSLPMWMVNRWGDGFFQEIKRHHKDVAKL